MKQINGQALPDSILRQKQKNKQHKQKQIKK